MLINLMAVWKNGVFPDVLSESQASKIERQIVVQGSFQFDAPPVVIFMKDLQQQVKADDYSDLPVVPLQFEEKAIYDDTFAIACNRPGFYNGKQMLLTGIVYDTTCNTLYIEAVRVDYVFLLALERMKQLNARGSALHHKDFFRAGVLAPFISRDDNVAIVTRKDAWALRSVAGGYLECEQAAEPLAGLISKTAAKEADEEFVHDRAGRRRLHFVGLPAMISISFRNRVGMGMTSVVEFVVPIYIKQSADLMLAVMNSNEAPDAHEHVPGSAVSVPVAANERSVAVGFMRQQLPGGFLYGTVLHTCAMLRNPGGVFASRIPEIPDSRFYPIRFFDPAPQKTLGFFPNSLPAASLERGLMVAMGGLEPPTSAL